MKGGTVFNLDPPKWERRTVVAVDRVLNMKITRCESPGRIFYRVTQGAVILLDAQTRAEATGFVKGIYWTIRRQV